MNDFKTSRFVSIIIPALNEERHIANCLESVAKLNTPEQFYEVIVVDNGSVDRTRDIAGTFKGRLDIQVLEIRDVNIATLRNAGVAHSKGDVLAFLDADCTVDRKWLDNAVRYFDGPVIAAVGSSHLTPEGYAWVARAWDLNLAKKRRLGETTRLPSGNMFVLRDSFLKIGGFNEKLVTNEDFDLCFRLIQNGSKLYSDPDISAVHWGVPNDLGAFYRQCRWHGTHVLRVFWADLKKLNNFQAVAYGSYFLCCLIGFIASIIALSLGINRIFFIVMLFALIIPPFLLSLKTIFTQHASYNYLVKLAFLYLIYGVARAHSMVDALFKNRWHR